jgi:hypothetical protein
MKRKIYLLLASAFLIASAQAQYQKVKIDEAIGKAHQMSINPLKSGTLTAGEVRSTNTNPSKTQWNPALIGLAKIHELPAEIQKMVEEKTALKIKNSKNTYPDNEKGSPALSPVLGTNFGANVFAGLTPPDNSMAISNGGIIVTVVNTNLSYYDVTGSNLYSSSFADFFNDPELSGMLYDPAVLYDSGSDRFFMVVLHATSSTASRVVVVFSKTNNPVDGWWYYKLTGNPLGDASWFDYPKIGVSNNEVYVTGNLFHDAGTYNQSVIYQITKSNGYSGSSLPWQYWYNVTNGPFTMVPASYGLWGNYGPGVYLVSSAENGTSSKINLYDLTDDITGSPTINAYQADANFTMGGNALQSGTSVVLNTDDTRIMGAFYLNGIVHFTFHSDRSGGYNGVNYNRLTVSSVSNWNINFGLEGYDYCYPSIASMGSGSGDKSVLITFSRSGSAIFPQTRVFYVDDAGTTSSSTLIKDGETYVDVYQGGGVTRWGDYTGICRKQNADPPEVWLSGSYGANQSGERALNTWIGQITWETTGVPGSGTKTAQVAKVYPNPVMDLFTLEFSMDKAEIVDISVIDAGGKLVKMLLRDKADEGKNVFAFNKGALSTGVYFLRIQSDNNTIANEKIVIQ